MFGDEDIINNRNYTTTVRCLSTNASLYCIKADEFINKFGKDEKTWKMVVDRACKRDANTKSKIKNCVINMNLNQQMKITEKQMELMVDKQNSASHTFDARSPKGSEIPSGGLLTNQINTTSLKSLQTLGNSSPMRPAVQKAPE